MGALIQRGPLCVAAAILFAAPAVPQQRNVENGRRTLFSQSAVTTLEHKYGKGDASYLLVDANSGAILASHWDGPDKAIPMGSLVKPLPHWPTPKGTTSATRSMCVMEAQAVAGRESRTESWT